MQRLTICHVTCSLLATPFLAVVSGQTGGIPEAARKEAAAILQAASFQGGLIVHLAGDSASALEISAALASAGSSNVVHALTSDPSLVEPGRRRFDDLRLASRCFADSLKGRTLPHIDHLATLIVADAAEAIPDKELLRVLSPGGRLCARRDGVWTATAKPWPPDMDEWTHYLHGAGGNPVSNDKLVGPPKHLQWTAGPTYLRHHDHLSGLSAMVSARGRLFYLIDLGPRWSVQMPPEWTLIARDAFNGVVLWEKPVPQWHPHLWPLKRGPSQVMRRMVADGDRLYVTLGTGAPVSVLDAATGNELATLAGTAGTEELIISGGVLFAMVNPGRDAYQAMPTDSVEAIRSAGRDWNWDEKPRRIVAVDLASGATLWAIDTTLIPGALAAASGRLCYHDGERISCVGARDGRQLWISEPIARWKPMHVLFAASLVLHDGVVLFAGGEAMDPLRGGKDTMTALDAGTGKKLWTAPHPESGYASAEDLMVINGLVWCGATTNSRSSGILTGRDPRTGEVRAEFPPDDWQPHMSHHRCHRAKATSNYLLMSRTGIEFVDLEAKHWIPHHWVRGSCNYGIMPANGLVYAPPHSCACYLLAKLNGLNALAPARSVEPEAPSEEPESKRLEPGPVFQSSTLQAPSSKLDWPTLRGDAARSGSSAGAVSPDLKLSWRAEVGGKLSSPVVAAGKVFVTSIDRGLLVAIDAVSGHTAWQFAAGGRIDSPPTVWRGRVCFGSADGHVYALRAGDGALAWRFRAAPADQRHMAADQIESVWPVSGNVLIRETQTASGRPELWCVAGRNMWLDGGMRLLRLDPETGEKLSETVLDDRFPGSEDNLQKDIKWPNLPVALPDVLSFDGRHVYMRSQAFAADGTRTEVTAPRDHTEQRGETAHLFSPTGLLDDSWWHRTYWIYGRSYTSGAGGWSLAAEHAPAGRILTIDDDSIYGFGRLPRQVRGTPNSYQLFACPKVPDVVPAGPMPAKNRTPATIGSLRPSRIEHRWTRSIPFLARAMVLAGDSLVIAGPPVSSDETEAYLQYGEAKIQERMRTETEAFEGRQDSCILGISKMDGAARWAFRLDSSPVFDGLAAAQDALFLSMLDGSVVRLGATGGTPLSPAPDIHTSSLPEPATAGFVETTAHRDFQHLKDVQIKPCELGHYLIAAKGKTGYALKQLPEPVTGKASFSIRIRARPGQPADTPGNGFLVFGSAPSPESLVSCGFRLSGPSLSIQQGSGAKAQSVRVEARANEVVELRVTVDLAERRITASLGAQTVEAPLTLPLDAIGWVGPSVSTVDAEFGPVVIENL